MTKGQKEKSFSDEIEALSATPLIPTAEDPTNDFQNKSEDEIFREPLKFNYGDLGSAEN